MAPTRKQRIRVRYAPSPTGLQHIGGLRTALYNYLYARQHGGDFILRIEDTDQKRFVHGAVENIVAFLKTFGLRYDEGPILVADKAGKDRGILSSRYPGIYERGTAGPYIQSERLESYAAAATRLVEEGKAYFCFCTEDRLNALRERQEEKKLPSRYDGLCRSLSKEAAEEERRKGKPGVVRFRVPDGRGVITCTDALRGDIHHDSRDIEDFVLLKSDGYPTYHFANILDDHAMAITHVFRGDEWLPSLPKHILLYEAFGWRPPHFVHLSVILGTDGKKKLSKRDGDVSVDAFITAGYLPEAILNFIALLGWNPGEGSTQELFTLDELVQAFSIEHLNRGGAIFDRRKLDWMNHAYIARTDPTALVIRMRETGILSRKDFIEKAPHAMSSDAYLARVMTIERDRLKTLADFGESARCLFSAGTPAFPIELLAWKDGTVQSALSQISRAASLLAGVPEEAWVRDNLSTLLLDAAGEKRGEFLWPLRVALSGAQQSPSPMDIAWVLGREETLQRLHAVLARHPQ
jgi:nondiscriminating glutamyl-tRNA synthetase